MNLLGEQLFAQLRSLELPINDYAVFGSGPLVIRGIIEASNDLDVVSRGSAWVRACQLGERVALVDHEVEVVSLFGGDITVGTTWAYGDFDIDGLIDTADTIEGLPFVRLAHVATYKRIASRPKDLEHLRLMDLAGLTSTDDARHAAEYSEAMTDTFVPADFAVPESFDGTGFRLEPLGAVHNERDFEAWMSSLDHIRATPGFDSPEADWPAPMSLEENLGDLVRHADDFAARTGFTYSILDHDDVIGCVYIYPSSDPEHDAKVTSWVQVSRSEMDRDVWEQVTSWLGDTWPFVSPLYASRD